MFKDKPGQLYYKLKSILLFMMLTLVAFLNFALIPELNASNDIANGNFTVEDFAIFDLACGNDATENDKTQDNYNCKILGFEETNSSNYKYSKTSDLFLGSEVSLWNKGNPILTGDVLYYLTGNSDYLNSTSQNYLYAENENDYYSLYKVFKFAPNWVYTNNYKYTLKGEGVSNETFYSSGNAVDSLYKYGKTEKGDIEYSIYFDISNLQNQYSFTTNDFSGFESVDSTVNQNSTYNTKITSISNLFSYNYNLYSYMITHETKDIDGNIVTESGNTTPYFDAVNKLYYIYNEENEWFDVYTFDSTVAAKWADSSEKNELSKINFYPLNQSTEKYIKTNVRAYYNWDEYEYNVSSSESISQIKGQTSKPADVSGSNTYTYYDNEETDYFKIDYSWSWDYIIPVWESGFSFTTDWYENEIAARNNESLSEEDYNLTINSSKTQGTYESVDTYNVVNSVKTGTTSSINKTIDDILYELSGTQYQYKRITTANIYEIDEESKQTYTNVKTIAAASQNCSSGIANGYQYTSTKCIFSKIDSGYRDYTVSKLTQTYYFERNSNVDKRTLAPYTLGSEEDLREGDVNSEEWITASKDPNSNYYYVESDKKETATKEIQNKDTYGWKQTNTSSTYYSINEDPKYSIGSVAVSGNSATEYTNATNMYKNGYYPYEYDTSGTGTSIPYSTTQPSNDNLSDYYAIQTGKTNKYSQKYSAKVRVVKFTFVYRMSKGTTTLSKYEGSYTIYAPAAFANISTLQLAIPKSTTCDTHSTSCPFIREGFGNNVYWQQKTGVYYNDEDGGYTVNAPLGERIMAITWYSDPYLRNVDTTYKTYLQGRNVLAKEAVLLSGGITGNFSSPQTINDAYDGSYFGVSSVSGVTGEYSTSSEATNNVPSLYKDNVLFYLTYDEMITTTYYNYNVYKKGNKVIINSQSSTKGNTGYDNFKVYFSELVGKTYNFTNYFWGIITHETNSNIYKYKLNGTIIDSSGSLGTSSSNFGSAPSGSFNKSAKKYNYYWGKDGHDGYTVYHYLGYEKKQGERYEKTGKTRKGLYSGCGLSCTSGSYKYDYIDNTTYYNWVVANTKQTGVYEYTNSEKPYTYSYFSSTPSNTTPSGNGLGSKYVTTGNVKYLYNIYERQVTDTKKLYRYDSTWRDYTTSQSGWISLGNPNYKGYSSSGNINSTVTTLNACTGNEGYNSGICYIYTGTKESQRISTRQVYKYDVYYNSEKVLKEVKVFSSATTSASTNSDSSSTTLNYANYIPNISSQTRRICSTTNDYNCYRLTGTNRNHSEYFKYSKHVITYKTTAQKTSEINGLENGYYDSGYIYKGVETINYKNAKGTPQTKNLLNSFEWFKNATTQNVLKYYNGTQIILQSTINSYDHVNYSGQNKITLKPNTKYTFTVNGYKDSNTFGKIGIILPNRTLDNTSYYAILSESNGTKTITFTTDSTGQIAIGYYVTCPNESGKIYINWMQIEEGEKFTSYSTYKTYTKQSTRTNTYYQYFHYTPTYNYYLDDENNTFDYEIATKIVKYTLSNGTTIENNGNNDDFEYNFVKNYINNNVKLSSIMIGYDFNQNGKYDSNEYWYYKNTPSQWITANVDSNGVVTQKYKLSSDKYQFYYSTSRSVIFDVSTVGNYFTKNDYTNKVASEGDIIVNFDNITQEMINNMSTTGNSSNKVLYKNSYYPEDSEIARYSLLTDYMKSNGLSTSDYRIVYNASKHDFYYYDQYLRVYYQHKIYLDNNKDAQGNKLDKGYSIEILSKNDLLTSLSGTNYFEKREEYAYGSINNGYVTALGTDDIDSMLEYLNSTDEDNKYGLLLYASLIDFAKTKYIVSNGNSYKLVSQNYNYNAYVEYKNGGYWETFAGSDSKLNEDISNLFSYDDYISEKTSLYVFVYKDTLGSEKYVPVWANNSNDAIEKATIKTANVTNVEFSDLNHAVILSAKEVLSQLELTNGNKIKIEIIENSGAIHEAYVEIDSYFLLDGTSEYTYVLTKKSSEFSFSNYLSLENLGHLYMDDNALGSSWYIYEENTKIRANDFTETFEKSLQYSLTKINDVESGGYAVHFAGMHNYWKIGGSYTINGGRFNVGSELKDKWLDDSSSVLSDAIEKDATINSNLFTTNYDKNGSVSTANGNINIPEVITVNTGSRNVTFYNDPLNQNTINLHSNVNSYDTYSLYAINYNGKTVYYEEYIRGLARVLTILYDNFAKKTNDDSYFFTGTHVSTQYRNLAHWQKLGLTEKEYDMYAPILFDSWTRDLLKTSSYLNLVFDGNSVYTYNTTDVNMQDIMKSAFTSNKYTNSKGKDDTIFVYDELYFKGGSINPYLKGASYSDIGRMNVRNANTSAGNKTVNLSAGILGDSYIPYYETLENAVVGYEPGYGNGTLGVDEKYLGTAQLPLPLSENNDFNCKDITYSNNLTTKLAEALTTKNMLQAIQDSWNSADKNLLYVTSKIKGLSLVYRKLSDTSMIRDQFTNTIVWGSKYNNGAVFANLLQGFESGSNALNTGMNKENFKYFGTKGFVATLNDYVPQNYYLDNTNNKMKAFEIEFSSNNFNTGSSSENGYTLMTNDILGTSGIDVKYSQFNGNGTIFAISHSNNGFKLWNEDLLKWDTDNEFIRNIYGYNQSSYYKYDYEYVFDYSINSNFYFFTFYGLNFDLDKLYKDEIKKCNGDYNVLPSEFAKSSSGEYFFGGSYLAGVNPSPGLYYTNLNNGITLPNILDYANNNFEKNEPLKGSTTVEDFIRTHYFTQNYGIYCPKSSSMESKNYFEKNLFGFAIYNDIAKNDLLNNIDVAKLRLDEVSSFSSMFKDSGANTTAISYDVPSVFYATMNSQLDSSNNFTNRSFRRVTLTSGSKTNNNMKDINLFIDFGTDTIKSSDTYTSFEINAISEDNDGIKGSTNFAIKLNLPTRENKYGISDSIITTYGESILNAFQNYEFKIYYIPKANENCSVGYVKSEGKCYLLNLENNDITSSLNYISSKPYIYNVKFITYFDEVVDDGSGSTESIETNTVSETITISSGAPLNSETLYNNAYTRLMNLLKSTNSSYKDYDWQVDKIETSNSTNNVNEGYWNILEIDDKYEGTIEFGLKDSDQILNKKYYINANLLPETEYYIAARIRFIDGSVSGVSYAKYANSSTATAEQLTTLENYTTPSVIFGYDMVNNPYGESLKDNLLVGCSNSICAGDELLKETMIPAWLNEIIFSVPSSYSEFLNNSFDDNFKNIMNYGYTPGYEMFKVYSFSDYLYNKQKEGYIEETNSKGEVVGYYKLYPVSNKYRLHLTEISVIGAQFKLLEVDSKTGTSKEITNLTGEFSFIKGNNPSLKNSNNTASTIGGKIVYSLSENDYIAKSNYNNELTFVNDYLLNYNIFNIYVDKSNLSNSDKIYRLIYSNQYGDMYSYIDYNMDNKLSGSVKNICYDSYGYIITEEIYHEKYLNSFYDTQWRYEYNSDGTVSERKFVTIKDKGTYLGHVRGGKVDTIIIG